MPFSRSSENHTEDYWTNHFENFLKPEIEKVPVLEANRSDELRADILKQIILNLYNSFIVVADLTDRNTNVFWELGIRQSYQVKTITIAEEGTKLPFDVSTKRTLFYRPNDPRGDLKFCEDLNKALIDCIENPEKSDSIVLDTLPGRDFIHKAKTEEDSMKKSINAIDKIVNFYFDNFDETNQRPLDNIPVERRTEIISDVQTLNINKEVISQMGITISGEWDAEKHSSGKDHDIYITINNLIIKIVQHEYGQVRKIILKIGGEIIIDRELVHKQLESIRAL